MLKFLHKRKSLSPQDRFGVPAPDPFENPLVETHPTQLRQWAAGLPFANPNQLAEAVITSLSRLNRFPGRVKRREELMQIYLTPVTRLYHVGAEQKNPLPVRLKRQLMQEMTYGYLHLINACLDTNPSGKLEARLTGFIYLAIKFIALEYLFACEEYDCRMHASRKEFMRLYTLAESLGLHDRPQDDPEQPKATISQQTKLILLLSLLDPCHLQQGEARSVFDYLSRFAEIASFGSLENAEEGGGQYIVDRLGEIPNQPLDLAATQGLAPARFCLFDVIPVSQRLHQHLRLIEQPSALKPDGLKELSSKAGANLIRRMLKSWHIRLQRDSERHETSGQIGLTLGLPAIHRQLSGGVSTPNAAMDSMTVTLQAGGLQDQTVAQPPLNTWRFNQSRSGVALHISLPLANPPQVGDIALLSKPNGNRRDEMKIGIIRRALLREERVLELGLQFINGRIVPIAVQALDAEPQKDQAVVNIPALYVDLGNIERSSLLVPKDQMLIGQQYRVEEMIPAPVISPIHLAEITAQFERFRVARV